MASLRRVRKSFRKEVLRTISAGDGNVETLIEIAGKHFGHDVGYEALIISFLRTEVSNAVTVLRTEGHIETIGKKWKPSAELSAEESEKISARRMKRIRGELKSQARFAHEHGLLDEATKASEILAMVPDDDLDLQAAAEELLDKPS